MAENNTITKEDLQNAVAQLTALIKEMAAATEAKLMAEMSKRFRRSDRQRKEFRDHVENTFIELRAMAINHFEHSERHTDEAVGKLGRDVTTRLDGIAGVIYDFRNDQLTMGAIENDLRADLDETKNSNNVEINNLKRRVTVLEEEVLSK